MGLAGAGARGEGVGGISSPPLPFPSKNRGDLRVALSPSLPAPNHSWKGKGEHQLLEALTQVKVQGRLRSEHPQQHPPPQRRIFPRGTSSFALISSLNGLRAPDRCPWF